MCRKWDHAPCWAEACATLAEPRWSLLQKEKKKKKKRCKSEHGGEMSHVEERLHVELRPCLEGQGKRDGSSCLARLAGLRIFGGKEEWHQSRVARDRCRRLCFALQARR